MENVSLLNSALRFLSRRPHTEKEVADYLLQRLKKRSPLTDEQMQEEIAPVMRRLTELDFVNDEKFALWWVQQRTVNKPKGWRAIAFELQRKGISPRILKNIELRMKNQESEGAVFDDENNRNEHSLALALAQKKMRSLPNLPREKVYQRLGAFLARRGFDMDTIHSVIDEVLSKKV